MTHPLSQAEEAKKEERPKSPGLLAKLLAPFKDGKSKAEKKAKAPKSPKKDKKKEEAEVNVIPVFRFCKDPHDSLQAAPPATEEAAKVEAVAEAPATEAPKEETTTEAVKET